jgi:hypothetical protein
MRRFLLFLSVLVAACSTGPQADLQYISEVRTLAAEWALVNQQAAQGKLTDAYVASMHSSLREQVKASAAALTQPGSDYAREMRAIAREPDDAPPAALRAHSDKLKQIEDKLESA